MEIALTYIFGIGRSTSRKILRRGGRRPRTQDRRPDRRRDPCSLRRVIDRATRSKATCGARWRSTSSGCRPRLLPRPPASAESAGARPAHAHQRAHPQGAAEDAIAARSRRRRRAKRTDRQGDRHGEDQKHPSASRRPPIAATPRGGKKAKRSGRRRAWRTSIRRSTTRSSPSPIRTGNVVAWASAGTVGFKGSRKGTPFAAQVAAETRRARRIDSGMRTVQVFVKGPGAGRESALRSLQAAGFTISMIKDVTPIPHNGCRPPKRRREC